MLNLQSVYLGTSTSPIEASEKTRIALDNNGVVHIERGGNTITLHNAWRDAAAIKGESYDNYCNEVDAIGQAAYVDLMRASMVADGEPRAAPAKQTNKR